MLHGGGTGDVPRDKTAVAIGRRLHDARIETGLERSDVAEQLHVTEHAYRAYERGDRQFPVDLLPRLPGIFGKPVTYFLGMPDDGTLEDGEKRLLYAYRELQTPTAKEQAVSIVRSLAPMDRELSGG